MIELRNGVQEFKKKSTKLRSLFVVATICISLAVWGERAVAASVFVDDALLSSEEIALMQEKEVYTVGYTNNYIPISYEVDGELTGIAIDILDAMALEAGITLEYLDLDDEHTIPEELDISLQMENFSDQQVSEAFLSYPTVLVTHTDFTGTVETVAVQDYFGLYKIDSALEGVTYVYYPDFLSAKDAFDSGEVDSFLMATLGYAKVQEEVDAGIYLLQVLETPLNLRFVFSDDITEEQIAVFDTLISNFNQSNLALIVQTHSDYINETEDIFDVLSDHFDVVLVVVICCLLIASVAVLLWQKQRRTSLEYAVTHDELTGLLSEKKFKEQLKTILVEKPNDIYHIIAFDIDNFKGINEVYGYEVGSKILQKTAECVKKSLESVEHIMMRDFADNFYLLVNGTDVGAHLGGGNEYEYMEQELRKILGDDYKFSFSLGIYTIEDSKEDIPLMLDCATAARDKGKSTIGYTVHQYTDEMRIARKVRNNILATMEGSICAKEVAVYYQPKISLETDEVTGAEALVRWIHDGKAITPNYFIPTFEKNGFITTLDYYVLDTVCRFIARNKSAKLPVISVNLSGITIMQGDVVDSILEVLERYKVESKQIEIEITESAFVQDFEKAISSLECLREKGFRIAMDDFGTGVSTLHRLREIPIDTLKIDRAFITASVKDEKGRAIIENIVRMAQELNVETVAEGIETEEQRDYLKALGCNVAQGYFYARPLPEQEFIKHPSKIEL
ncbi:MAG: EAL domain-containing protein [Eubacteriales bacterium]